MTRHRDLEPATQRGAMNCGYDGFVTILDVSHDIRQMGWFGRLVEFTNVRPGDEGASFTSQDDGANGVIGIHGIDTGDQALPHRVRQSVHGRIVDHDGCDAIFV
jgi:hypothetical protein